MASLLEEIRQARLAKIELLKKAGIDAYPSKVPKDFSLKEARERFATLEASKKPHSITGRVMAIRGQGAIFFVVLDDGTDKFQAVFKEDSIDKKAFKLFNDTVDIGDIVSVTGTFFATQRGEQSLLASAWTMASKSLLPLPEKWHGLQDEEEKLRKRYLDMVMTPGMRDVFYKKAQFWDVTRKFLTNHGFLEVETPTLELTTGGAEARPFETHHNDYDLDVFLRISVGELWQKRLMAAGFPKTFEIGRVYRNEGSSPEHLQEFTNMEFYWSYADYKDGMKLVRDLYRTIAKELFGTTKFTTHGHAFDLADDWKEIRYADEIKEQTGIDIAKATNDEIKKKLTSLNVKYEGDNRERLTDTLWKYCRKNIAGPAFLIEHPVLVAPLAKSIPGKGIVQMFQPIIAGSEVGRGYSELNDPVDQKGRFEAQQKLIDAGDDEAMMADYEFIEMLEHGMPPTCGFGFGERFFAFLADKPLREVQLFPLMRPKEAASTSGKAKGKSQKIAVALINEAAATEGWQKLNTAAHLSASLGARLGRSLLHADTISTKDGEKIHLNIQHAIILKSASSNKELLALIKHARAAGLEIEEFTREMITSTNDKKVIAMTVEKDFADIERLGVLVFGEREVVEAITKDFPLAK